MAGHLKKRRIERADGTTYLRWRARIPNPSRGGGAKVERTFGTKREAERWLTSQQSKMQRGEWIDPSLGNLAFEAVTDEWRQTWLLDGLAPKTRTGYESILRKHVLPEFGRAQVSGIGTDALQAYLDKLVTAGLQANTVRRIYTVVRNVFAIAVERRYIGVNPCDGVRFRAIKRQSDHRHGDGGVRVIVTEAEARALAEAIAPHYRVLVLTTAYTGMRAGEVRALRRRDVDLLRRQVMVQRAVKEVTSREVVEERERGAEVYGNLVFGPTKTYERRRITLPDWLAEEVERHLETRPASPNALVFTTEGGEPIRQSNFLRRHFKPAARAALPEEKHGLRFHDLRHSHASWLIARGAQALQVMKRLGHRDIRTTYNTYGHVFPSDEAALAGMFAPEPEAENIAQLREAQ